MPPGSQFSTKQTTQIRKKHHSDFGDFPARSPAMIAMILAAPFLQGCIESPENAPQNLIINDYYPLEQTTTTATTTATTVKRKTTRIPSKTKKGLKEKHILQQFS